MINFKNKWKNEDLLKFLPEFYELYKERPIKDNNGGMKSPHMFPSWFIVKMLQPKFLIESGVWKGLGTWFFRKASPNTKIISIDPEPKYRVYTDENVEYLENDFLTIDWSNLDSENCLVFFDDHQDCVPRIKKCKSFGLKKIIFEDNYPYNQGDCYSPKKVLSNKDYIIDTMGNRKPYQKRDEDLTFFNENISIYQEMPPIFKDLKTRWGNYWDEEYQTPEELLPNFASALYPELFLERFDYTWICYMELI